MSAKQTKLLWYMERKLWLAEDALRFYAEGNFEQRGAENEASATLLALNMPLEEFEAWWKARSKP